MGVQAVTSGAWRLRRAALQALGPAVIIKHCTASRGTPPATYLRGTPAPDYGTSRGVLDHGTPELFNARGPAGEGGRSEACGAASYGILHQGWRALLEAAERRIPALHFQGARKGTAGGHTRRGLWASLVITDPRRQGIPQWVLLAHRTQ